MDERIENIKPLELYFCLSNIHDDEPLIKTQDIKELLRFLVDYRTRYGSNWNENLLFHVDLLSGTTIMIVDVAHIELFV